MIAADGPLYEHTRRVVAGFENFQHHPHVGPRSAATTGDQASPVVEAMPPRQQLGAGWRTHWSHMEIRKPHTLLMQAVEIGCPVPGIFGTSQVGIANISHQKDDNVRRCLLD